MQSFALQTLRQLMPWAVIYQQHIAWHCSVCPPLVTDWTIMERAKASEEVRKPGVAQ